MVLIIPALGGGQMSGSLGGTTWSHNRYGMYGRARTKPINPKSARQVIVRNLQKAATAAWKLTLTADQRAAWAVYAANTPWVNSLGQTTVLTPKEHFIRSAVGRQIAQMGMVLPGPSTFGLPASALAVSATASVATQIISVAHNITDPWIVEDAGGMTIAVGRPQSPTRNFYGGPFTWADCVHGAVAAPPASPELVASPYVFGLGAKIWVQLRVFRADGRLSAPWAVFCLAAA